jgi:hypothetical protein
MPGAPLSVAPALRAAAWKASTSERSGFESRMRSQLCGFSRKDLIGVDKGPQFELTLGRQCNVILRHLHTVFYRLPVLHARYPQPGSLFSQPRDRDLESHHLLYAHVFEGGDEEFDFRFELAVVHDVAEVVKRHGGGVLLERSFLVVVVVVRLLGCCEFVLNSGLCC